MAALVKHFLEASRIASEHLQVEGGRVKLIWPLFSLLIVHLFEYLFHVLSELRINSLVLISCSERAKDKLAMDAIILSHFGNLGLILPDALLIFLACVLKKTSSKVLFSLSGSHLFCFVFVLCKQITRNSDFPSTRSHVKRS